MRDDHDLAVDSVERGVEPRDVPGAAEAVGGERRGAGGGGSGSGGRGLGPGGRHLAAHISLLGLAIRLVPHCRNQRHHHQKNQPFQFHHPPVSYPI